MDLKQIATWAKDHPAVAAASVFGGGFVFLYLFGFFGSSSGGSDPNVAAYYGAQAADAQSANALEAVRLNDQTAIALGTIEAGAKAASDTTWSATDEAINASNNQAAIAEAPFAVETGLISTLGAVASIPPTTTTSTKKSSGFFGIGGGSKTTTTVTPNPAATAAANALAALETQLLNGLIPGH